MLTPPPSRRPRRQLPEGRAEGAGGRHVPAAAEASSKPDADSGQPDHVPDGRPAAAGSDGRPPAGPDGGRAAGVHVQRAGGDPAGQPRGPRSDQRAQHGRRRPSCTESYRGRERRPAARRPAPALPTDDPRTTATAATNAAAAPSTTPEEDAPPGPGGRAATAAHNAGQDLADAPQEGRPDCGPRPAAAAEPAAAAPGREGGRPRQLEPADGRPAAAVDHRHERREAAHVGHARPDHTHLGDAAVLAP